VFSLQGDRITAHEQIQDGAALIAVPSAKQLGHHNPGRFFTWPIYPVRKRARRFRSFDNVSLLTHDQFTKTGSGRTRESSKTEPFALQIGTRFTVQGCGQTEENAVVLSCLVLLTEENAVVCG